jgi:hypothetical protein
MSGTLSCSALNCVHNLGGLCSANSIEVVGYNATSSSHTHCKTFAEKNLKNALTHVANMNIPGEIRQLFSNSGVHMSPKIHCEAVECAYNEQRICAAPRVQIVGDSADTTDDTNCETFVP